MKWKGERHLIKVVKQGGDISDSCLLKLYAVGGRGVMGRPRGRLLHSSRQKIMAVGAWGERQEEEIGAVKSPDSRVIERPQ